MPTNRLPMSTFAGDMISLRSAMDRLFNESFVPGANVHDRAMPLDAFANEDAVHIIAAVPGMDADQIKITIDKNTVTLAGTVADVAESEEAKSASWLLRELPTGAFERSLTLPFALDANRAEATFENGLLHLVLPKAESEKPRQIRVKVGSGAQPVETESAN